MPRYNANDLWDLIKDVRHDTHRDTEEIRRLILALTTAQAAAIKGLTDQIEEVDRSVDAAFAAATTNNQALRDQVATLTTTISAMESADTAEDAAFTAQIADLGAARDAIQATLDSQETDVLDALGAVATKLGATDAHIDSLGAPTP